MSLEQSARQCAHLIKEANSMAALTGAGISTNAGLPDFRGPQGLYITKKYDADKVFDINYFLLDPQPFYEFACDFVGLEQTLQPTFAHRFLSQLERQGKFKGLITQNIDGLHQRAGSQNVLELHGSFERSLCLECGEKFSYTQMKGKLSREKIPTCPCGGVIKPEVVFFGENVRHLEEAYALAESADLFFLIGTSCVVYPAALIPGLVRGKIVIVNKGEVQNPFPNVVLSVQEDIDKFLTLVAQYLG